MLENHGQGYAFTGILIGPIPCTETDLNADLDSPEKLLAGTGLRLPIRGIHALAAIIPLEPVL